MLPTITYTRLARRRGSFRQSVRWWFLDPVCAGRHRELVRVSSRPCAPHLGLVVAFPDNPNTQTRLGSGWFALITSTIVEPKWSSTILATYSPSSNLRTTPGLVLGHWTSTSRKTVTTWLAAILPETDSRILCVNQTRIFKFGLYRWTTQLTLT